MSDIVVEQHFVTFYSPGTFFNEESTIGIDSWNVDVAVEMSRGITERHESRPYSFVFTTRGRGAEDLDSRELARSNRYYLGGTVRTLADVKARNDDADKILISNMEVNGWDKIVTGNSPWRWTQPLQEDDVILEVDIINEVVST